MMMVIMILKMSVIMMQLLQGGQHWLAVDDLSRAQLEEKSEFLGLIIMQNLVKEQTYPPYPHPLLQLAMSQDEHFVIGTFMTGFQLWKVRVAEYTVSPCIFDEAMYSWLSEATLEKSWSTADLEG